jgi:hypothetical protein
VAHLISGGPSSGLGLFERVLLACSTGSLGPGPAKLHARPLERLGRTGHMLGRPAAMDSYPAADSSPVRLPQRTRSLGRLDSARFEMRARAINSRATAGGRPLAARVQFQRASPVACRGGPAAASPQPPVPAPGAPVRPEGRQSGVSIPRLHQYPNTRWQYPDRANG